jgi:RHS repeat-associated protein
VQVSYTYAAFGAIRSQSVASGNDYLFAGEQRDAETGLYNLRARYYDERTGRFLSTAAKPNRRLQWRHTGQGRYFGHSRCPQMHPCRRDCGWFRSGHHISSRFTTSSCIYDRGLISVTDGGRVPPEAS